MQTLISIIVLQVVNSLHLLAHHIIEESLLVTGARLKHTGVVTVGRSTLELFGRRHIVSILSVRVKDVAALLGVIGTSAGSKHTGIFSRALFASSALSACVTGSERLAASVESRHKSFDI